MNYHSPENIICAVGGRIEAHFPPDGHGGPDAVDTSHGKGATKTVRTSQPPNPLSVINPATLSSVDVRDREWIIPDWLGVGYVTVNYAPGGEGKSQIAQQLMTSTATGHSWCGLAVARCRSFALFCEDDPDELHRRQARINAASGLRFDDLDDMRWASGVGQDNALAHFRSDGRMSVAHRFAEIKNAARDHGAKLIVLDTVADLFAGDENDRQEVHQFIGLLTGLALDLSAAVLLNAHPSRSGMAKGGDMDGGSTAWSNSVRSRWSLSRPKGKEAKLDDSVRVLTRRKANYASSGDTIRLRWQDGLLVPVELPRSLFGRMERQQVKEVFLILLDDCTAQGVKLSHSKNAANFAPAIMAKRSDAARYTRHEFDAAMSQLFVEKLIVIEDYGRKGDPRQRIARAPEAAQ